MEETCRPHAYVNNRGNECVIARQGRGIKKEICLSILIVITRMVVISMEAEQTRLCIARTTLVFIMMVV